jgi:predicted nucleic acid-binding protein
MTILLDTSILIDHLRGGSGARGALAAAATQGQRLTASVVVEVEVLAGMRPSEEPATRRLLDALEWFPVDELVAEQAGLLANRFLRSHPGVDPVDYVIAATAVVHDARLWTRNVKHFPMFADLEAPYWYRGDVGSMDREVGRPRTRERRVPAAERRAARPCPPSVAIGAARRGRKLGREAR